MSALTHVAAVDSEGFDPWVYLDRLASFERTGHLAGPSLGTMTRLMAALGDPQYAYPAVHVTGTNGKGSTSAMITCLLSATGLRVGTYTSPHIDKVTERIQIDGDFIGEESLSRLLETVRDTAQRLGLAISWFEAITAVALLAFAEAAVNVAVVEVGMLGRWDATNVVDGVVTVVTNVEFDHTDLAGPTRANIASEKAGIVKEFSTLILGETEPALYPWFAAAQPQRLLLRDRDFGATGSMTDWAGSTCDVTTPLVDHRAVRIPLIGVHQTINAAIAIAAAEAFTGESLSADAISRAFRAVRLPGRQEVVSSRPVTIVDGAHNPAGATALRTVIDELVPAKTRKVLVCGVLVGRDLDAFLAAIDVASYDCVIATEPNSPRALSARTLAAAVTRYGTPVTIMSDPAIALIVARKFAGENGVVVATGSLYLVSPLRHAMSSVV